MLNWDMYWSSSLYVVHSALRWSYTYERLVRVTRMKSSESYVYRKIGRKLVRVSCMSESFVRGTRASEWLAVNNQWDDSTELNFDLLKNGRYWFGKTVTSHFFELYGDHFAMECCKPPLQRQKHRLLIAYKFSILMALEAMFTKMEEYISEIR